MQHLVNKALTRCVAANLVSRHLATRSQPQAWECRAQPRQAQGSESSGSGCVWNSEPERGRVLVHSPKLELHSSPEPVMAQVDWA